MLKNCGTSLAKPRTGVKIGRINVACRQAEAASLKSIFMLSREANSVPKLFIPCIPRKVDGAQIMFYRAE